MTKPIPMSANPSRGMTENQSLPSERLDEETERLLQAFQIAAGNVWNDSDISLGSIRWQVAVENRGLAKDALRSRIRSLIEEARTQGAESYRKEGWK